MHVGWSATLAARIDAETLTYAVSFEAWRDGATDIIMLLFLYFNLHANVYINVMCH